MNEILNYENSFDISGTVWVKYVCLLLDLACVLANETLPRSFRSLPLKNGWYMSSSDV